MEREQLEPTIMRNTERVSGREGETMKQKRPRKRYKLRKHSKLRHPDESFHRKKNIQWGICYWYSIWACRSSPQPHLRPWRTWWTLKHWKPLKNKTQMAKRRRRSPQTPKPFRKGNCYTQKNKKKKQTNKMGLGWCLQSRLWLFDSGGRERKEESREAESGKSHDSH